MTDCCQVTTTVPDHAAAQLIAADVIERHLAACAQVIGPLSSTYQWQGRVESAQEWYCHLKTTLRKVPALEQRIRELHPYDVPEIIAIPIAAGDERYLAWVRMMVGDRDGESNQ